MAKNPLMVDADATVVAAVNAMNENRTGCVLVQQGGNLVGIFTERDVLRKVIFRDFYHIWQAKRLPTLLQRYRQVVRTYRTIQPKAVRCLRSDFRATLAYFAVHPRHPDWSLTHLRTTSRVPPGCERFNRRLRRRARAASAYHSDASLQAMLAHEVNAFHIAHPHP
jgi:hypothetical protein